MISYRRRLYGKEERNFWMTSHPTFIKEKVIVVDTRKNPEIIATTNLAFA